MRSTPIPTVSTSAVTDASTGRDALYRCWMWRRGEPGRFVDVAVEKAARGSELAQQRGWRRAGIFVALLAGLILVPGAAVRGIGATVPGSEPKPNGGSPTANRGLNSHETVVGPANVSKLTTAWTGATGDTIESSAVIADGVVYVGSEDGKL